MNRRRPLVIGHRGAPGYRPEHSRSAYDLALAMGVDAVEPDVVVSKDGVLVVRHENEISGTTDVGDRAEFASRHTTKQVDGVVMTGWFTEDFTWDELATLRCRERLPQLRPSSASFDDSQRMLCLRDVLDLVRAAGIEQGREIGVVVEVKHASYFEGIGLDIAPRLAAELAASGWADGTMPLVIESFEKTVLEQLRATGIPGTYIYLLAAAGRPFDQLLVFGTAAATYRHTATPAGLDALVGVVDGISVDKHMILAPGKNGAPMAGPTRVVADAHARGLQVFTWTLRPENRFLVSEFRGAGASGDFGHYEEEWAVIRDTGVDGVFVDHADLGVEFFGRK